MLQIVLKSGNLGCLRLGKGFLLFFFMEKYVPHLIRSSDVLTFGSLSLMTVIY